MVFIAVQSVFTDPNCRNSTIKHPAPLSCIQTHFTFNVITMKLQLVTNQLFPQPFPSLNFLHVVRPPLPGIIVVDVVAS